MAVIGANSAEFFYVFLQLSSVSFSSLENVDFSILGLFQEKDVVLWIGPGVSPVPICLTFEALRKKKGPADVL